MTQDFMSDYIVRATAADASIRAFAINAKEMVETARVDHNTSPVITAALGRLLAAGAMMGSMMKGDKDVLTLRIQCSGPAKGITVTADAHGNVKGFVANPDVDLPPNALGKLDVGGAIGEGDLYISKDIGLKEPYTGSVPLVTGEIGDDVASYLMNSEQTPSVVSVGVLVNPDYSVAAAGGIIIQAMPGADDAVLDDLEMRLQSARAVSSLINEGADIRGIIQNYLPGVDVQFLEEKDIQWNCNCSHERISGLLKSIGVEELEDMIEKDGETEVVCHFCSSHYHFDKDALEALLADMKQDLADHA